MTKILFPFYSRTIVDRDKINELIKMQHIGPLSDTNVADFEVFFYGPWLADRGEDVNFLLLKKCLQYSPNIVIFWNGWQPEHHTDGDYFPKLSTIYLIRKFINAKLGFFWTDISESNIPMTDKITAISDFSLTHEHPSTYFRSKYVEKYFTVSTVYSSSLFHAKPTDKRKLDVLFIGEIDSYKERLDGIHKIQRAGISIFLPGGSKRKHITNEEYAYLTKNAKIVVNWTKFIHGGFHQAKGRIFEATLAGCLLISEECDAVNYWLEPNIDYIPFSSNDELIEKLKYFLDNENERSAIAKHGHNTSISKYSAKKHFENILDIAENHSSYNEKAALKTLANNSSKNELNNIVYIKNFLHKEQKLKYKILDNIEVVERLETIVKQYNTSIFYSIVRINLLLMDKYINKKFIKNIVLTFISTIAKIVLRSNYIYLKKSINRFKK